MRASKLLMIGCGAFLLACSTPNNDPDDPVSPARTGGSSGGSKTGGSSGSSTNTGGSSSSSATGGSSASGGSGATASGGSGATASGGSGSGGASAGSGGASGGTSDASADDTGPPGGGGAMPGPGLHKIFDGTTLMGWTSTPEGMFAVKDGAMVATGKGRGAFATNEKYTHFRILFSLKPGGTGGHAPTVLVFCNSPGKDALGGIQFQPPNGGTWDYRPGKNNAGKGLFMKVGAPGPMVDGWHKCEIVGNAMTGEAKMACGGKDVLHFKDPTAGMGGMAAPFAIQTHNAGITDQYKDLSAEDNIASDDYTTVK
jgi:hypothetical protein